MNLASKQKLQLIVDQVVGGKSTCFIGGYTLKEAVSKLLNGATFGCKIEGDMIIKELAKKVALDAIIFQAETKSPVTEGTHSYNFDEYCHQNQSFH